MAKCIMIQGTMSGVGKSVLVAGLCRIFRQDGHRVAPFKSQNMALNSFVTAEGLEMGRAQAMQAEAAGLAPSVLMNPILLKPTGAMGSQVILNGEVLGTMNATEYASRKKGLMTEILRAFDALSAQNDIIVIEGAGSPAEINLKADDIVNMGMAMAVKAPVLLTGDIDRGGVFATLYGTVALLTPEEQALIKGLIINKFRGDVGLLQPGLTMLEELVKKPVLGVVPMLNLNLEDEDGLAPRLNRSAPSKALDVAVIRLPHISNFTDFNPLECFDCLGVRYVQSATELGQPDLLVLPGTKNTMSDLLWLRQNGLEAPICAMAAQGVPVLGVCGGYQMLGQTLRDPEALEQGGTLRGLGLLPVDTLFERQKTRAQVTAAVASLPGFFAPLSGCTMTGYEIHMGQTTGAAAPFAQISKNGVAAMDGAVCGNVMGSYLHGMFEGGTLATELVRLLCARKGIPFQAGIKPSFAEYKEQQYDFLASELRKALDLDSVYRVLEQGVSLTKFM